VVTLIGAPQPELANVVFSTRPHQHQTCRLPRRVELHHLTKHPSPKSRVYFVTDPKGVLKHVRIVPNRRPCRGMLVALVARRLGVGRSSARPLCCPALTERGRKKAPWVR